MIQDTSYRRVGSDRLNKVGVVAIIGALAAIGMVAVQYKPQVSVQRTALPQIFQSNYDVEGVNVTQPVTDTLVDIQGVNGNCS